MDSQEIRTLKILEAIDQDQQPSQRDLAKRLNISLGLANSFIKRLAQKGYFKVRTIPKNRVKYILTPKGMAAKTRLTYAYIHYSFQFYKDARQKIREIFQKLGENGVHRVVFYGAGDLAEIAYISLKETKMQLVAVVDETTNTSFFEHPIVSDHILQQRKFDKIIITMLDADRKIVEKLKSMGVGAKKIVSLN